MGTGTGREGGGAGGLRDRSESSSEDPSSSGEEDGSYGDDDDDVWSRSVDAEQEAEEAGVGVDMEAVEGEGGDLVVEGEGDMVVEMVATRALESDSE